MQNRITDRLVRVYEVTIWPLDEYGKPDADGPYDEPIRISLGYAADEVPTDPFSDKVKAEALKRALKVDGWEPHEIEQGMATNSVSKLDFKFPKFIRAEDTNEAKRAAVGAAR